MYSFIAVILSFFTRAATAFAEEASRTTVVSTTDNPLVGSSITFTGPFGDDDIVDVLDRLILYAQLVASSVAAIMILWGAFQILTSRGSEKQYLAGRQTIIYALGGLAVVVLASGLVDLFSGLIGDLI